MKNIKLKIYKQIKKEEKNWKQKKQTNMQKINTKN